MYHKQLQGFLDRNKGSIYSIFRIAVALLFFQHGAQKLYGWFGGTQVELMSIFGLAGVIEFYAGILIALGLFTRYAAFLTAATMLVGYFMVHFPQGWVPIMNSGENALLFLVSFLVILFYGPGKWALDNKLFGKKY